MKVKSLKVNDIPVPSDKNHPPPPNILLPKHPFTMGVIAPKGSGKTTLLVNILKFYSGYFHGIFIFSPTVNSDEKWEYVKNLKLLAENKKLKNLLMEIAAKKQTKNNEVVQPRPEPVPKEEKNFDPVIKPECFIEEYSPEDLKSLLDDQMNMVKFVKSHKHTVYDVNRLLFIFDDQVGSDLFTSKRQDVFKKFNTAHRHYSISALMVTQAYKEIPKTVRTQYSCLVIFEINNEKEIDAIYEENPMGLKFPVWLQVFTHCTAPEYGFMFINYQKPKAMRIMCNFEKYMMIA